MPDKVVEPKSAVKLAEVHGDLRVGRGATITAESGRKVTVRGSAHFEGPVTIGCDFECKTMRVEGKGFGPGPAHGNVVVKGDLVVHGDLEIDASAEVAGEIAAERVDIGGHLISKGVTAKGVRVGGHMRTKGPLAAEEVDVGGHFTAEGLVDITSLRVGGHAELGGGSIRGEIRVRGHLRTRGKLSYGNIQVFGHLTLPAGSSGERLDAIGKVEFEGDTSCKVMEVNGAAKVDGDCAVGSIKVNGKLEVERSLRVSQKLAVYGSAEAGDQIECESLEVGGRLAASRVAATGQAEVAGELWTARGLRARDVAVGSGSRVNGPIIGESVEIGKGPVTSAWAALSSLRNMGRMTRVDDVYGKEVRVDRYSRARRIFAETVRMQSGSMADEVIYTKEADVSEGVHLEKPPRRVERLPDAPS